MEAIDFMLGLLFLVGTIALIAFPSAWLLKWLYRTIRAERKGNFIEGLWCTLGSVYQALLAVRHFGWRKCVMALLVAALLLMTLPITIHRVDYAIRSTIIRRKMGTVITKLEGYGGHEPWRACSTCPYETGTEFGWQVWDWAYGEFKNNAGEIEAQIFILVAFNAPEDIEEQIWSALYWEPGLRFLMSEIERVFPEARTYLPMTGPNLGPMVYKGRKYPVVPSEYMTLLVEAGKYEWQELTELGLEDALDESVLITWTLFFGPQIHSDFLPRQVFLLPWYARVEWDKLWFAFIRWATWHR